jgi:deferrochelatase/peroxidase EfeB/predicted acylesterase/phospholipase RssA
MTVALRAEEVQRLALSGYDLQCSLHLVLGVEDAAKARELLADLLQRDVLTFGDSSHVDRAVNIGFTCRGLEVLGLDGRYKAELEKKAPAFCEGAPARAARRLGDAGPSAAERWEPAFSPGRAHVLISIHGGSEDEVRSIANELGSMDGAREAFAGWLENRFLAKHLTLDPKHRTVHFGFRDLIAKPKIAEPWVEGKHHAGELVLGYPNDAAFNRWGDKDTGERAAAFFLNASFGVLRKVEQDEKRFNEFVEAKAREHGVTLEYIKAKLCGRWPNGMRVRPGEDSQPDVVEPPPDDFDFKDDTEGLGCPFGAHIRRTNPRGDPMGPSRKRPLFRRGMPYGPRYEKEPEAKRGLIGLFFCASIEDQFEHVMLEWVEKRPLGPPNRGDAKDPLMGNHDAPSVFHIPQPGGEGIKLTGFDPFVTTKGTLYALFPSRSALRELARVGPAPVRAAQGTQRQAAARTSGKEGEEALGTATAASAPPDRFCDIVMEGGVTSGIIYSSAVAELAKSYRFKSIGGSSIGAFAAALTAAAEYRRRHGSADGFDRIADVPEALAKEEGRKTRLLRMFRPQDETRRLFEIFLATLGKESRGPRLFYGLKEAFRQYRRSVLLAAVVTTALVLAGPLLAIWRDVRASQFDSLGVQLVGLASWGLALLIAVAFAALAALAFGIVRDFARGVMPNGFGLCRGWSGDQPFDSPDLDLTGYLHVSIQAVAGRSPIDHPPLTFQDLWDAPGSATNALGYTAGGAYAKRSINLEVYATNLTHGRPYRFPLEPVADLDDPERPLLDRGEGMGRLFFRVDDMKRYFPEPIVRHLVAFGRPYRPLDRADPAAIQDADQYLELPREQLPIAVAARLALSFPLLISAVPLFAIDHEPKEKKNRQPARCWLSDGGLCSNFPIHLFDSFVPKWPTFGISLQTRGVHRKAPVWLPNKHYEGGADTWDRFDDAKGLRRLTGFLLSLWAAAWRWNDMTMMRMPGVRDRVVRVLLEDGDGGVNINMPPERIRRLAERYGKPAAEAFRKKFAAENSVGWPEHRWVRFNRLLIALRQQIDGAAFAARLDRYTSPLADQIDGARDAPPLRGPRDGPLAPSEEPLNDEQVRELKRLLAALRDLEVAFDLAGVHEPYIAVPRPSLRVRHPT